MTLENLENAFYHGALAKYDEEAFTKAGPPPWVRGRYAQIAETEAQHVALISRPRSGQAVHVQVRLQPSTRLILVR